MTGPAWDDDRSRDKPLIVTNAMMLASDMLTTASQRLVPTLSIAKEWHKAIYAGCAVPSPQYVGNYRGDRRFPDLVGYEVGTADLDVFGRNQWLGVPSDTVLSELNHFEPQFHRYLAALDAYLPSSVRVTTATQVEAVAQVAAVVHGEWIRIHPFANGNGRTARAWVNFVSARYGLPSPWGIKPEPSDPSYLRATRSSLGRKPDYSGDHHPAFALLAHRLAQMLRTP